jgi:hypothetical protein
MGDKDIQQTLSDGGELSETGTKCKRGKDESIELYL